MRSSSRRNVSHITALQYIGPHCTSRSYYYLAITYEHIEMVHFNFAAYIGVVHFMNN